MVIGTLPIYIAKANCGTAKLNELLLADEEEKLGATMALYIHSMFNKHCL